ncbi:MAG: hypothetical protein ACO3J3_03350 [Candidatus Nanopelagicales bacterium]
MNSADSYAAQVVAARRPPPPGQGFPARAWFGGRGVIVACLVAWLGFGVSLLDSLEILLAIGVAGLLGGVGLYATSRSLALAASRLEIDVATKLR